MAWKYQEALKVIHFCKDNNLFIYGGDVLSINKDVTRRGVDIRVVQDKYGEIITGFPTNSKKNPK